ncbi:hypothetical protein OBBRIDRAFT_830632 [Obba rivulosa]|uniref:Methyltransferase type 11 domain-containing protein n=1 Tax=Obba rivulosa TaxID=1052685 RepID=A0A8E2DTR3_9APHY|nr:hypothetical protein OBBRIDRAFT_830632 [Obba rivulosa]
MAHAADLGPQCSQKPKKKKIPELENMPCYDVYIPQVLSSPTEWKERQDKPMPPWKVRSARKASSRPVLSATSDNQTIEISPPSPVEKASKWKNVILTPPIKRYAGTTLFTDRHAHDLYSELVKKGQPTFYDFETDAPKSILSLGRSDGYWVSRATKMWPSTTRCEIIFGTDVYQEPGQPVDTRVHWRGRRILEEGFPYPEGSFEFIRIANMCLHIRDEDWGRLLAEAHRLLVPGGVLEVVDDVFFFPSIPHSRHRSRGPRPPKVVVLKLPKAAVSEDDASDSSSPRSSLDSAEMDLHKAISSGHRREKEVLIHPEIDLGAIGHDAHVLDTVSARELEFVFEEMLKKRFGITSDASKVIEEALHRSFGSSMTELAECHIAVPPREYFEEPGEKPKDQERPVRKRSGTLSHLIRKAADAILRHDDFEPPYWQPPGLVYHWRRDGESVSDLKLLKLSPEDLELHACQNIQTLLDCKAELVSYVNGFVDAGETPPIDPEELHLCFSDYEQFKRKRFNWPSESFEGEGKSNLFRRFSDGNLSIRPGCVNGPGSVEVRTIKIFHATKGYD